MHNILLKDFIKGKDHNQLIKDLPYMVCYDHNGFMQSYDVLGFGPDFVILGYAGSYETDETIGNTGSCDCEIVDFKDLDEDYIYAHKCSAKQAKWLKRNGFDYDISGYEAWNIINKTMKEREQRKKAEDDYQEDNYWDAEDYWDYECTPWGVED